MSSASLITSVLPTHHCDGTRMASPSTPIHSTASRIIFFIRLSSLLLKALSGLTLSLEYLCRSDGRTQVCIILSCYPLSLSFCTIPGLSAFQPHNLLPGFLLPLGLCAGLSSGPKAFHSTLPHSPLSV